jgi:lipid-binding SYLF domain-containing protein
MTTIRKLSLVAALVALLIAARAEATLEETSKAIAAMEKADPGLSKFFGKAADYAVFPEIGKGGFIVGGAGGSGYLFEGGKAIDKTTMAQATTGAQVGGQTYYEVMFFEAKEALAAFKKGEWTMAAQASVGGQKFTYTPLGAKKNQGAHMSGNGRSRLCKWLGATQVTIQDSWFSGNQAPKASNLMNLDGSEVKVWKTDLPAASVSGTVTTIGG